MQSQGTAKRKTLIIGGRIIIVSFIDAVAGGMTSHNNHNRMPRICDYIIWQKTIDVTKSLNFKIVK